MNKSLFVFASLAASITALAQTDSGLSARRLFYQDNQPEVVFRATAVAAKPIEVRPAETKPAVVTPVVVAQTKPTVPRPVVRKQQLAQSQENKLPDGTKVERPKNFGVRYNLIKVDAEGGDQKSVPSDTNFKKGDCVAVSLQPNRGGILYVFNQASSGKWQPLLPSPEMVDEANTVRAFQRVTIPSQYCFEMDDPPGEERLFVLITEREKQINSMDEILQMMKQGGTQEEPKSPSRGDTLVLAQNKLNGTLNGFARELASRDIKITRVNNPVSKDEPAFSVYLVNASTSSNDFIMEVKLSHK